MAKRKKSGVNLQRIQAPLVKLQGMFNNVMSTVTSGRELREKELDSLNNEIDDVIYQQFTTLDRFTGKTDTSSFLLSLYGDREKENRQLSKVDSIDDIFMKDKENMLNIFQDRYRNSLLKMEDLYIVSTQLFELEEAILATRDSMVNADDMSTQVSRTIKFKDTEGDKGANAYISVIEDMEEKYDLLSKLKDHIIPNTLRFGKYYVYTAPYSKLFSDYYKKKQQDEFKNVNLMESVTESFIMSFKNDNEIQSASTVKEMHGVYTSILENVGVINDDMSLPVMESASSIDYYLEHKFPEDRKKAMKERNSSKNVYADGVADVNNVKEEDFSLINECYIKLIDPRSIIPIKILDEVIGYYYIHQKANNVSKKPFSNSIRLSESKDSKDVEEKFLSSITDRIVKAFDKKFLEENPKFRKLILSALQYHDIYSKNIKFQFIPAEYITEFKVDPDPDGEGQSILNRSLFYAKLYLSLLLFKLISIIAKSNDTKIYYIKNSGIDKNIINKVQETARAIKERQVTINDLMNYNTLISKVGAMRDIFMPVGRSGEKAVDFDVIAGQDIQLNSDLMDMLRTGAINSTGVPSVIMNYVNEVDFAKNIAMANNKFLGRCVSHQISINRSETELYKKIAKFSSNIPEEMIDKLVFALATPRALTLTNMSDIFNNADQEAQYMVKGVVGDNDTSDEAGIKKDILYRKYLRKTMHMIPWNMVDEIYEETMLELRKKQQETGSTDSSS